MEENPEQNRECARQIWSLPSALQVHNCIVGKKNKKKNKSLPPSSCVFSRFIQVTMQVINKRKKSAYTVYTYSIHP